MKGIKGLNKGGIVGVSRVDGSFRGGVDGGRSRFSSSFRSIFPLDGPNRPNFFMQQSGKRLRRVKVMEWQRCWKHCMYCNSIYFTTATVTRGREASNIWENIYVLSTIQAAVVVNPQQSEFRNISEHSFSRIAMPDAARRGALYVWESLCKMNL